MLVYYVLTKRFWPLLVTQFFGAVNDNFLKNAILVLVTYRLGKTESESGMIANAAAGLFITSYFLFSTFAGQLADKCDKARYCQTVKLVEILLMLCAGLGFLLHSVPILLGVFFFMGAQSTFFSPAKYALLPTLLNENELLGGNAWLSGSTYFAILLGMILGGVIISLDSGDMLCGVFLVVFALAGYGASRAIPATQPDDSELKLDWNIFRQTWIILRNDVWPRAVIRQCIFSLSVVWLAGSLYVTQIPGFTKRFIGGDEVVCTFFLTLFSIGVAFGAALANKLYHGKTRISAPVIVAIALMGLFTFDLALIAWTATPKNALVSLSELTGDWTFYRACADMLLIAACGGIWTVPVQAMLQRKAERKILARVIAGNNIVNSLYMAGGAAVASALLYAGFGIGFILACTALALAAAAGYTGKLLRSSADA